MALSLSVSPYVFLPIFLSLFLSLCVSLSGLFKFFMLLKDPRFKNRSPYQICSVHHGCRRAGGLGDQ